MDGKQHEITLSVIVPCYNVEPYLDRSLYSLSQQWNGRTDYEIILVNDASTDNSLDKLVSFKEKHPDNVVLIDKKDNEGVAAARNSGLDIARGQWIVMFDPDDALAIGGYDYLIKNYATEEVDIVSFGVFTMQESNAPKQWDKELVISNTTPIKLKAKDFLLSKHIGSSINFLYSSRLLKSHRYPSLSLLEDIVFNLPLFLSENKVVVVSEKIYYYLTRDSSATNTLNAARLNKGCDDIMFAIEEIEKANNDELSLEQKTKLHDYQKKYTINLLNRLLLSDKSKKEIKQIRNRLKKCNQLPLVGSKGRVYNFIMATPSLITLLRPLYRLYRRR